MNLALRIREMRRAASVVLVWVCAAPLAWGQQTAPPQPAQGAQPQSQPPPQPRQVPAEPLRVFRYPAAVSGSRFLTSVYGPTRPTWVTQRLTHVPDMFGDSFLHGQTLQVTQILFSDPGNRIDAGLDLPVAGGAHLLVAENNKALPTDRVYVNYNHFHNALLYSVDQDSLGGAFDTNQRPSVDRFTFGLEKTFFDGVWSAEVRVPFAGENNLEFFPDPGMAADGITAVNSSVFGNVSLILKTLLYADDSFAMSGGLGVECPTGDDAQARVGTFRYVVENDAFHLHPYLAVMGDSADDLFFNAFLQLDLPTGGNDLRTTELLSRGVTGRLGTLDDQVLLHLNVGGGFWFFRTARRTTLTGLAGLLELQ
jgi:hypothetical protein